MSNPIRITRIDAYAYRCPTDRPVETSFGVMYDRPAVFVRIEDADGATGWGEIFANWPAAGAEHRVRLLELDIAPLVIGQEIFDPVEFYHQLERQTHIRAVQCGERGPFRQVIAGLDIAIWDLLARRAGVPLRRLIRADAVDTVGTYASGIQIGAAPSLIPVAQQAGYCNFKVKVGFDMTNDIAEVKRITAGLKPGEQLAADANQAWTLGQSQQFLDGIGDAPLQWLEEPMPVFTDDADWTTLGRDSSVPIAGGENIAGYGDFDRAIALGALSVIQPDVAKWGGISGCLEVAKRITGAGRRYCPHFLGGGIGLIASAELLAGVGGDGILEVDVNPNPTRTAFWGEREPVNDGLWSCGNGPGLGIENIPAQLEPYKTMHREIV